MYQADLLLLLKSQHNSKRFCQIYFIVSPGVRKKLINLEKAEGENIESVKKI